MKPRSHPWETEGTAVQAEGEQEKRPLGGNEFGLPKLQQDRFGELSEGKVVASQVGIAK